MQEKSLKIFGGFLRVFHADCRVILISGFLKVFCMLMIIV
jgi:hypothetical protein